MKGREFLAKLREDPEFVRAYDELQPEFQIAREIIRHRIERGWTQKELAERAGTAQPNISRLENAVGKPSVAVLERVAGALGVPLHIHLGPPERPASRVKAEWCGAVALVRAQVQSWSTVYPTVDWLNVVGASQVWHSQMAFDLAGSEAPPGQHPGDFQQVWAA